MANPAIEAAFGRSGKFNGCCLASSNILHFHEHPHKPPTLALVAFGGIGAVALEVDVINERVGAVGRGGEFVVVRPNAITMSGGGGGHDPGQCLVTGCNDIVGL